MNRSFQRWAALAGVAAGLMLAQPDAATAAKAAKASKPAEPQAEEHILANGMKVILVPRHISPTVAAGWVARVGSANERPGITGISHLFEHMMFKGTHVIGTRDVQKDLKLIEEQEKLRDEMRAEESKLRDLQRRGKIQDMTLPEAKTARYKELEAQFDKLIEEQRANMIKNEFNQVLQKNGATFINAFTNEDQTFYFETVPANKLELWFWIESDRLKNPVFREFYSERDVVYEERRMRTESTPTGRFQQAFDSMFWEASPYAWPVIGWPSDIANITKAQADEYFGLYYAPQNLSAILVGDFDPKQALAMAEKYLGSIPKGARPTPEMITTETKQLAEKRFLAEAETSPAVDVRWHAVAFTHQDVPALMVLGEVLDGPTGRLNRSLVLGQGIATTTSANADPKKYEGSFEIHAECKDGTSPDQLEKAIHAEIDKLSKEPVTAEELQSARNRYMADNYRRLTSNFQIMLWYGVGEGRGSWRDVDRIAAETQNVTAADLQRVVQTYFTKENRAVALWNRKGGTTEDPALAALPPQAQTMARQMLAQIAAAKDPAKLEQAIAQMDGMAAQMPPEMKPAMDYIKSKAEQRLAELKAAGNTSAGADANDSK